MTPVPTERLGALSEIRSGITFPLHLQGRTHGDIPFAKVADISRAARRNLHLSTTEYAISADDLHTLRTECFPERTIAFAKIGESIRQNFRTLTARPMLLDNNSMGIICNPTKVTPEYLVHFLRTVDFYVLAGKTSVPALRKSTLERIPVPLPPLAEQRRIAAILDKADALRRKRQEAIALTEQLLRSTFLEMFGDPVTNPKRWPTRPLGDLITDGPTNGLYRPASDYGSGTPIIRIDAIQKGQIQEIDTLKRLRIPDELIAKFSLTEGDLLVNRVNSPDLLGKIALIPALAEATVYESNMMRFRVNQTTILPEYLTTLWQTPFLSTQIARRRKDASNQSSINQGDVQSFEVHIPPIDLQRAFRSVVRRLSHHERLSSAALTDADALFNSLTHRAFTGQL